MIAVFVKNKSDFISYILEKFKGEHEENKSEDWGNTFISGTQKLKKLTKRAAENIKLNITTRTAT